MLSSIFKNSLNSYIIVNQNLHHEVCISFIKRFESLSLLHRAAIHQQVEGFPVHESSKKYKKPVDWLPFPWHRRPMFNIYENSGDLVKTLDFDPSSPKPGFEHSDELKTASEDVKKVFSLESASKAERKEVYKRELLRRVQRHPHDYESLEAKIAMKTADVRSLFDHSRVRKKDIHGSRVLLAIFIQKRNKMLNKLRKIDHDRYLWVMEQLQLEHTPDPLQFTTEKYCKKWDLRRLTKEYCKKTVHDKKAAYHEELKKQQKEFLKEKDEILAWIEKEEKALEN